MELSQSAIGARLLQSRLFVRAPIWVLRRGGGWLFAGRVLLLEHRGRVSGRARYVCLEVVDRPTAETVVVVSGFGQRAQWYRNLMANPACFVSIGRQQRLPAHARLMSDAEAASALGRYQRAHPRAWGRLRDVIERAVGHPVDRLPMVELTLLTSGLPPVPASPSQE